MKLSWVLIASVVATTACAGDDTTTADSGTIDLDTSVTPDTTRPPDPCETCFPECTEAMSMNVGCASTTGADCSACVPPCNVWQEFFEGIDLEPYCNAGLQAQCVDVAMFDDTGPYYLEPSIPNCVSP